MEADPFCGDILQNGQHGDPRHWLTTFHNDCGERVEVRFAAYCCAPSPEATGAEAPEVAADEVTEPVIERIIR
jgi:hypothetical protein